MPHSSKRSAPPGRRLRIAAWLLGDWGLIFENDVQSVQDTRQVTQDGQQDVDEEIGTAAALQEDTQRREDDGKNDLADIAGSERHVAGFLCGFVSIM